MANQKAGYDKVHYADAREGWWAWMAGLYLLKGAVDRGEQDACYRFAEFVTSGLYGAATGTLFGYAHMNAATPDYAKAHEQDMGFNAAAVEKRNKDENAKHTAGKPVYWRTMFQDYLDIYEQEWTKISSA